MTEDNLTKEKLKKMIGTNRFDKEGDFKDFLKPLLAEALVISKDRLKEETRADLKDDSRFDFYVYDKEAEHEMLLAIGLKLEKDNPQLSDDDQDSFQRYCMDMNARYGALLTESEHHFYQFEKDDSEVKVVEIDEIPPLSHIDYQAEQDMGWKESVYQLLRHQWAIVIFIVIVLLLVGSQVIQAIECRTRGPIKTDITQDGTRLYYTPDVRGYENVRTGDTPGERRFCTEEDAQKKGWIKPQK